MALTKIGWFEKLMALVLTFLTLLMFFGASSANHASIRDVDSTLGILARPSNSKIVKSFKAFISPIKADAQRLTKVIADIPRIIERALNKALKQALSALINQFINVVLGLFDQLISAIEGWVGTIDGLREAVGAFRGAVALKAYQVSECLVQSTESIVNDILPVEDQSIHDPEDKCNGVFGSSKESPSSELNNVAVNAVSNHRVNYALRASQEGIPNSLTLTGVQSEEALAVKKSEIATTLALANCVEDQEDNQGILSQGAIPPQNITSLRSGCSQQINDNIEKITDIEREIKETTKKAIDQTITTAPADCQNAGYVTGLQDLSSTEAATEAANDIQVGSGGVNFSISNDLANGIPNQAEATFDISNKFDLEVPNNEQCASANSMPAVLESANQTSAGSSGSEFNFDAVIQSFVKAFTKFITNIITKVFTVLTETINNFLKNAPGGQFLSQAITNVVGSINEALVTDINNIANEVTNDLIGNGGGNNSNTNGPVGFNPKAIENPIG